MVTVALRPVVGAYVLAAAAPLTIGLERGVYLPVLRPHEALLLIVAAGIGARWLWENRHRPIELHPTAVHVSLLAVAVASSVIPLAWLAVRGLSSTSDDISYAFVVWKYFVLFVVVRYSVRTTRQVTAVLRIWLAGAAIIGVISLLQVTGFPGVEQFLGTHYAPLGDESATSIQRATSTLGSSFSVGDVMAISLAVSLTWLIRGAPQRLLLSAASGLFALGAVASGQFSGFIALGIAILVVGALTKSMRRLVVVGLPTALVASVVLRPVLERRLSGFSAGGGLPFSWQGRLNNLETFFWPEIFQGLNWVLGVRPAGRIPAPLNDPAGIDREFVFIESGHTLLLWTGGVPLLLAFFAFMFIVIRITQQIGRTRVDAIGVAAVGAAAGAWIIFGLALLDMHLTLRGTGDLFFTLLALALTQWRRPVPEEPAAGAGATPA